MAMTEKEKEELMVRKNGIDVRGALTPEQQKVNRKHVTDMLAELSRH